MKSERERELRWRLRWLEQQVESTKRALRPFEPVQQGALIPAPAPAPRQLSEQQEDYAEWSATRGTRLDELEVDPTPEPMPPIPFINATMKRVRQACGDDDRLMARLFDRFFALDYPARMDPPYPFNAFVKKWPELLAEIAAAAPNGAARP